MVYGMVEVILRVTCPNCGQVSEVPVRRDEVVAEDELNEKAEPIATFRNAGTVSAPREFKAKEK